MSSGYDYAELERRRQEQLEQQFRESLEKLKSQMDLRKLHTEDQQSTAVRESDPGIAEQDQNTRSRASFEETVRLRNLKETHQQLDLTGLRHLGKAGESEFQRRFRDLGPRAEQRAVLSGEDAAEKKVLLQALQKLQKTDMDEELRLQKGESLLDAYLSRGVTLDEVLQKKLEDREKTYLALCRMVRMEPRQLWPDQMEPEILRLEEVVRKRRQEAYIMNTLSGILEEMNCHLAARSILDHTPGLLFSVDGSPLCDVFMGTDGYGILFEPITDRRRKADSKVVFSSIQGVCGLYDELERRAREKGILLTREYQDPPDTEKTLDKARLRKRKRRKPGQMEAE